MKKSSYSPKTLEAIKIRNRKICRTKNWKGNKAYKEVPYRTEVCIRLMDGKK